MIPVAKPWIGLRAGRAFDRVLKLGPLARGPEVKAFEEEFFTQLVDGRPLNRRAGVSLETLKSFFGMEAHQN